MDYSPDPFKMYFARFGFRKKDMKRKARFDSEWKRNLKLTWDILRGLNFKDVYSIYWIRTRTAQRTFERTLVWLDEAKFDEMMDHPMMNIGDCLAFYTTLSIYEKHFGPIIKKELNKLKKVKLPPKNRFNPCVNSKGQWEKMYRERHAKKEKGRPRKKTKDV